MSIYEPSNLSRPGVQTAIQLARILDEHLRHYGLEDATIYGLGYIERHKPTPEPRLRTVPEPRGGICGRRRFEFLSDGEGRRPVGYLTVLEFLAYQRPDILDLVEDFDEGTKRDGFWLYHRCKERGIRPVKVKAPTVLREKGIEEVNAYPVSLLRERFGG
jgi:hypothetical protein